MGKRLSARIWIALLLAALCLTAQAERASAWVDCGMDLARAEEIAGFDLAVPALSNYTVAAVPGKLIELRFPRDEHSTIALRKSSVEPETGDISGDETDYPQRAEVELDGGAVISLRGRDGAICVAAFTAFDGAYSVSCAEGMTPREARRIVEELLKLNAK